MNAMTLNMTTATAGAGDNSKFILDALVAKMTALGKSDAIGGAARRDAGIYLTQEAYAGNLIESDAALAYDTYVTSQGKTASAKHMIGGDNPKSRNAQVSKFNSFIKLGMLPDINGPEVLARAIVIMKNLADAEVKVTSGFDALKAICTAQEKQPMEPLTDEQIAAVVSKPDPAEKDAMVKLVAAYKAAYKLNADLALPGTEVAMQGYADAITELGGELPPMTKDEKKEAEALAFLAKRGKI
jgi:hypothetical protein